MSAQPDGSTLASALHDPGCYPHAAERVDEIETHISRVFLTGEFAYKLKKPVKLPFLDFTSLAARRRFCDEELRLNRRLAPELYLAVMPVTGTDSAPRVGGSGPVLDYVVQMRQFDQSALLDRALERHAVDAPLVASLARDVERFHARALARETSPPDTRRILAAALENFDELQALLVDGETRAVLDELRRWTLDTFNARTAAFEARDVRGFIRECHGDLHLGNIVLWKGRAIAFDCIEFNAQLRWIDVIDEVAFTAMDFAAHDRTDLAGVFLNEYLEASGDYGGVDCLPFYLVYRAMVRAKVNAIRASQPAIADAERSRDLAECHRYIEVARVHSRKQSGALIITHGYAGSGKSTLARELVAELGAICIRSDVERKRLHGLDALADSASPAQGGIYAAAQTRKTYAVLLESARHLVAAGFTAIVDATFLQAAQRAAFQELAAGLEVPFAILDLAIPDAVMRERIVARARKGGDASEATPAVLDAQIASAEPLNERERAMTVTAVAGSTARSIADALARHAGMRAPD